MIRIASERGIPVLVDPARLADVDCYCGATLLKPNRIEAELAAGFKIETPQEALIAGEFLCRKLDLNAVVITLDHDGMVLSRRNLEREHFPASPRKVCDITGAGDMALAVLGLVLADAHARQSVGSPLQSTLPGAVQLANIASGLQVERLGVTSVNRAEIRAELQPVHAEEAGKVISLQEMQRLAERYRRDGKTVVFTNGCFDLLHVGHLTCLQRASKFGDVLIVAVNSDESVRRLKGPDRPVIAQQDRAALLAGLACVDHVLIFDDATPVELPRQIRPDVLVKGETTQEVIGREIVEEYGGKVCVAGLVNGVSTTQLIQRTRETTTVAIE